MRKIPCMRTFEYRFGFALVLAGALSGTLAGAPAHAACAPPPGFVDPPVPKVGPLEGLISRTEVKVIDLPMADALKRAARPLEVDQEEHLEQMAHVERPGARIEADVAGDRTAREPRLEALRTLMGEPSTLELGEEVGRHAAAGTSTVWDGAGCVGGAPVPLMVESGPR